MLEEVEGGAGTHSTEIRFTDGARRGVIDRFEDASKMVILISDVIALFANDPGLKQRNRLGSTQFSITHGNASRAG